VVAAGRRFGGCSLLWSLFPVCCLTLWPFGARGVGRLTAPVPVTRTPARTCPRTDRAPRWPFWRLPRRSSTFVAVCRERGAAACSGLLGHQGVDERPSSEGHLVGLLAVGISRRSCAPGRQCFGWLRSACLVFERHPGSHSERPIWHSPPRGVGVIGTASSASHGSVMTSVVIGSQPGVFVGIPRTQVLRSR
jgi:hypothetical protein